MPVFTLLIALCACAFGFLAWRDFKLALTLLVALLPIYLIRFQLVIPWTLLEVFILTLFGVWFFKHNGRKLRLKSLGIYRAPLFFLLAIATFSVLWAPDQTAALGVWKAFFIEPMLVFVMLRSTFTERKDWIKALYALSITVCVIVAFALIQKLTGLGIPVPWDVERRATSIFEYPNAVGLFVAPLVAAFVVMSSQPDLPPAPSFQRRGWWLAASFAGGVAIVLAQTEAALVAIPAALLITLLISTVSSKIKITTLVGAVTVGVLLFAVVPTVREKLLLQDYSGEVRRSQWLETVELLKDKPAQGAGLAGYPNVFTPYHDPTLYEIFQYPHNLFLNFWVEMGIFGVLALLWLMWAVGKTAHAGKHDTLTLAAVAALLTMAIHGLVDVPFFKNDLAVLTAFFLAMTLAYSTRSNASPMTTKD